MKTVAQHAKLFVGHLLDLVRYIATLDIGPERPSLDRLGEDDGGSANLQDRSLIRGVQLLVVVATPRQRADLVICEVLDQCSKSWIGPEEVIADVVA